MSFTSCFNKVFEGFSNFLRSSFLSILFLVLILLLINTMDQSYTMLVDMIERDRKSLMGCTFLVFFFALTLSHYPIYNYYALDVNNSKKRFVWHVTRLLGIYPIFTFSEKLLSKKQLKQDEKCNRCKDEDDTYHQNNISKFLRHFLGLVIFFIWHYYIYKTFAPKFTDMPTIICLETASVILIALCIAVSILLGYLHFKKIKIDQINSINNNEQKINFIKRGRISFVICFIGILICWFSIYFTDFRESTFYFLQLSSFLSAIFYVLLRIFRSSFKQIEIPISQDSTVTLKKVPILHLLTDNRFYISLQFFIFCFALALFVYCNLAVYYFEWVKYSGLLIVFTGFYLFYYIIACFFKYVFVIRILKDTFQAKPLDDNQRISTLSIFKPLLVLGNFAKYRLIGVSVVILILGYIGFEQFYWKPDRRLHELPLAKHDTTQTININEYFKRFTKNDSTSPIILLSAHGGALKANIWTALVLNELQKQSKTELLKHTASLSGASGGMMGLSIYTAMTRHYGYDNKIIKDKIDALALKNFISDDLSYTLGYDYVRKLKLLDFWLGDKDRAYYSMRQYQNSISPETSYALDDRTFKNFWYDTYTKTDNQFPILLLNTAKTNGKRGVFSSVNLQNKSIFINSDNLSEIGNEEEAITYYMAVSSTNRFPVVSPAAKIKHYGHYIDAGVIDNSGILSNLDLFNNYIRVKKELNHKKVMFIDINNGKESYIIHWLKKTITNAKINGQPISLEINEVQQDNIAADLAALTDIDKIPQYLNEFLEVQDVNHSDILYRPIYLPFTISLADIEAVLEGELNACSSESISKKLKIHNSALIKAIEDESTPYWDSYEPTLARQLSESTRTYYHKVIEDYKPFNESLKSILSELNQ